MLRNTVRAFSTNSRLLAARKYNGVPTVSGTPVIQAKPVEYNPQVFSPEKTASSTDRPFPINVELNYWAPIRHEPKYGDLVANIQLRSYDVQAVKFYSDFIQRAAYYLNIPVSGSIPLPKRRERWTVIKSPFAQAKTKENYQRITHRRLIRAFDATPEVLDLWISFFRKHAVTGLGIKVETFQQQSLDFLEELDSDFKDAKIDDTIKYSSVSDEAAIRKRVDELLNDPVFKQHLEVNENQVTEEPKKEIGKKSAKK